MASFYPELYQTALALFVDPYQIAQADWGGGSKVAERGASGEG